MEVEIDDVAHLLAAPIHHPVMAVKWCAPPKLLSQPGQGTAGAMIPGAQAYEVEGGVKKSTSICEIVVGATGTCTNDF
eukprot:scaffold208763_cov16-Tisochrysis_lutea.AAC.1